MAGKFDSELAETLYGLTLDGTCDTSGDVDAPEGWFALVEDHEDMDWIVREDHFGFVTIEGPLDHIDIGSDGYYQPSRVRFDELCSESRAWFDGEDEAIAQPGCTS